MEENEPSEDVRLVDDLRSAIRRGDVITDRDRRAAFEEDWTGRFGATSACVVRPDDAGEVRAALETCGRHQVPVVPQGGNTGLVGGGVPRGGEVVISLTRLDEVSEVDRAARTVTVGAGVTLGRLQNAAEAAGLYAGMDFAARDTATLGGIAATNAGGSKVVRYGFARDRIQALDAVLPGGKKVAGSPNSGDELGALLIGSEGTLGVITGVTFRLEPDPGRAVVAVLGLESCSEAFSLITEVRRRLPGLESADLITGDAAVLAEEVLGLGPPLHERHEIYLLLEHRSHRDPAAELAGVLGNALDGVVADHTDGMRDLWRWRDAPGEAVAASGFPLKLDVVVPPAALDLVIASVRAEVGRLRGAQLAIWGHLLAGDLHINVVGASEGSEEALLRMVLDHAGSIAAEHGIGIAKARHLDLAEWPSEIVALRALKRSVDPDGIMNPGVIFP